VRSTRSWLVATLIAASAALLTACDADATPAGTRSAVVSLAVADRQLEIGGGACTWYEASGQLFVEAGDAEGAQYVLLGAPLEWIGEALPEGPGNAPELSIRLDAADLDVDQGSLAGTMSATQQAGSFTGRLADGTPLSGEWTCPEVVED
jgi:hypothetical protein